MRPRLPVPLVVVVAGAFAALAVSGESGRPARCTIVGTAAAETLVGTPGPDVLCAGAGDDTIRALGGNDILRGGAGDDVLYPGGGRDSAAGEAGNDTFVARDRLVDSVDGGPGRDRVLTDGRDRRRSVEWLAAARPGRYPVLLAAGDIGSCSSSGDEATGAILDLYPWATVAALGDTVYERGTPEEFADCYAPSAWGRALRRTRPAVGNHEYLTPDAAGYFAYFGARAGRPGEGWYSYELGGWHVVVLNTNCENVGCAAGSAQEQWLRADLAEAPKRCTLAYGHHALFSSRGPRETLRPLWIALAEAGVDVVVVAHAHYYERFAPARIEGAANESQPIRVFIVGTGGKDLVPPPNGRREPGVVVQETKTFGVLKLVLAPASYSWEFIPIAARTFRDAGKGRCT